MAKPYSKRMTWGLTALWAAGISVAVGGLLTVWPFWGVQQEARRLPPSHTAPVLQRRTDSPPSPSRNAREQAWQHWKQAQQIAASEREALLDWDPKATLGRPSSDRGRPPMTGKAGRELLQAQRAAHRAAMLAKRPEDAYEAIFLLSRIDCDLGDHAAELQQARRLLALAKDELSLTELARAARCNGLSLLAQRAEAQLAARHRPANVGYPVGPTDSRR